MDPRVVLVFLLFLLLLTLAFILSTIHSWERLPFEKIDRTTDLAQSAIRPGLNIDNLPIVRVDYGSYRPNTSIGDNDNNNSDDNDSGIVAASRRQQCLTRGAYLGRENLEIDCSKFCNVAADEVAYVYIGQDQTDRVIRERRKTIPGGYCMPTLAATCNRVTSIVAYSIQGWLCIPASDAFAGEGGNRIVVCNGTLLDRALGVVYHQHIPPNLQFNNVYSDRTSDGSFRFECPPSAVDTIGNRFVPSPVNRLHIMRNWCVSNIPYAASGKVVFYDDNNRARCSCESPLHLNETTTKCETCWPRFDKTTFTITVAQHPCFSFQDDIEHFAARAKEVYDTQPAGEASIGSVNPTMKTMFPCGWNAVGGGSSEWTLPRCLDTFVGLNRPPLPSPMTLRTIDNFLSLKSSNVEAATIK